VFYQHEPVRKAKVKLKNNLRCGWKVFFALLLFGWRWWGARAFVVVIYLFVCSHPTRRAAEDGSNDEWFFFGESKRQEKDYLLIPKLLLETLFLDEDKERPRRKSKKRLRGLHTYAWKGKAASPREKQRIMWSCGK
jgi:hypothetical protein